MLLTTFPTRHVLVVVCTMFLGSMISCSSSTTPSPDTQASPSVAAKQIQLTVKVTEKPPFLFSSPGVSVKPTDSKGLTDTLEANAHWGPVNNGTDDLEGGPCQISIPTPVPNGPVTATCGGALMAGTLIKLETIKENQLLNPTWGANCGNINAGGLRELSLGPDHAEVECDVTFDASPATLTLNISSGGSITVTPDTQADWVSDVSKIGFDSGNGITSVACTSANCSSFSFQPNTKVTVTPTPNAGYTWSAVGDCGPDQNNQNQAIILMDANKTCTVTFTNPSIATTTSAVTASYTLSMAITGSGTVTSTPALTCTGTSCTASATAGTAFTLTATPATGSTFAGFGGDCTSSSITLNNNMNCTATFTVNPSPVQTYTLTLSDVGGSSDVSVTSSPTGINCSSALTGTCSFAFNANAQVTLSVNHTSQIFAYVWGGDCTGQVNYLSSQFTVTMDKNKSCTVSTD